MKAIVEAVHKSDALSVVNEVYADFKVLLEIHLGANDRFTNYKACFHAQTSKRNAHGKAASLFESLLGMMLLTGSSINDC